MTYANIISTATLVILVWYAYLTWGIEKEAVKQTEGLSKPVVTAKLEPALGDDAILSGASSQISGPQLSFINIGNGPALEVRWDVEQPGHRSFGGAIPYLTASADTPTAINVISIAKDDCITIKCAYASASGVKYVSELLLDGKLATQFRTRRM